MAYVFKHRHSLCEVRFGKFDADEVVVYTVSVDHFENVVCYGSVYQVAAREVDGYRTTLKASGLPGFDVLAYVLKNVEVDLGDDA